jgi:DNA (cytosine-5)-methyltransferase 1
VFIVSIRKDIDNGEFKFPESFPLELRLKDMLEDEVDEKFYLKETQLYFIKHSFDSEAKGNGFRFNTHVRNNADVAKTITTRAGARMDDNFVMDIESNQATFKFDSTNEINMIGLLDIKGNEQVRRVYGADGISPTLNTMQGGNRQPKIFVREATKKGYAEAHEGDSINLEQPNSKTRRGRVGKQVAQTLTTSPQQGEAVSDLRIRKLTPKECYRLMGFDDEDFAKAEAVNSNAQLYKQAGNSIVVDVVEHLIKALCKRGVFGE